MKQGYCERCGQHPPSGRQGKLASYCKYCIYEAVKALPNPDCEYCLGNGEYYWHSENCDNDLCALSGGYDDCNGQMVDCDCSMLDGINI